MKQCILCNVTKPISDFHVKKDNLDGKDNRCKCCKNTARRQRYAENKEYEDARNLEWMTRNRDYFRAYNKEYYEKNRADYVSRTAKRRAAKLQATPDWANLERIKGLYKLAAYLTEEYGVSIHVDHIVPLQSTKVCGLHVEENLQLLYAEDNCRKNNTFEV